MRRIGKILAWTVAVLVGLPVLLVLVVLVGANTAPGRRMIEHFAPSLTGGEVHIAGLAGRFPDRLRAATLQIDDAHGPYLTLHGLVLDWAPLQLLHGVLDIGRLDAGEAGFARMPVSSGSSHSSGSSSLPVAVTLRQVQVDRLDIAAAVAGKPYAVAVQGAGALTAMNAGNGTLTVQQIGGNGRYRVSGRVDAAQVQAAISLQEQAHGLIADAAGLPDLGAIDVQATLNGPRDAVATGLTASAGPLRATVHGRLDLVHDAADLDVVATAPAMTPRPDVSWQDVAINAHLQGRFTTPELSGQVRIDKVQAAGTGVAQLAATLSGNAGIARLHAVLTGLTLPGQNPGLFAAAPMVLDATARLNAPDRPVTFTLQHPLVQAQGTAQTAGKLQAHVALTLPDLAPVTAAAGQSVQGNTALTLDVARQGPTTDVALRGTIGVTGGQKQAQALLGTQAQVDLEASLDNGNATLHRLHVTGRGADVSAHGSLINGQASLDWAASIADLTPLDPALNGKIAASGQVSGPEEDLTAAMTLHGEVGSAGVASGPVTLHAAATGLPNHPAGTITAQGALLNAPIDVVLAVSRNAGGVAVTVQHATWKSLLAQGALSLPTGAVIPQGQIHLQMTRLADLAPLLHQNLSGSIAAALDATPSAAKLTLTASGLAMPGTAGVARVALDATVTSPQDHPSVVATLTASGVSAGSVAGAGAQLTARGSANALALTLAADAPGVAGAPARVTAAATLDAPAHSLALTALRADWKGQVLRLLGPATLGFANGATVGHLRLGVQQAVLTVNGRVSPTLDLDTSLRNVTAGMATAFVPTLQASGSLAAEAHLTGTTARPIGTIHVTATGLRETNGAGRALPPANLVADATLRGTAAGLNAQVTAGSSRLALTGTAPLATTGAMDLHATGSVDLALLNPILTAQGRRVQGRLALDAAIAGSATAPRLSGTVRLTGGEVQDYANGVRISDITALVQATGDAVRVVRFSGQAGAGTIGASGSIGLAAPMPVNLTLTTSDARLLSSPLITLTVNSHLTVQGDAEGSMTAAGAVHINGALIQIPDKLPTSVAVLPVRVAGAPRPPPATTPPPGPGAPRPAAGAAGVALNVTVDTTREVVIRGRGLNVALGGTMHVRGTAAAPRVTGGLDLQRGTMSLVSQTLTFNQGSIDFVGNSIADPGISLVATSSNNSMTATLTVSGTAQQPKISLTSVPALPQDQVLAQLLFNQSIGTLSPFQVAEVAAALAQLSGAGGGVADPLSGLRNSLGLDQLSVGSSSNGSPSLQAGRYVAPGVYLGAQQSATGTGTQATLQINLTKGLKVVTSAGTSTPSATGAAASGQGASVGLTYQFQY